MLKIKNIVFQIIESYCIIMILHKYCHVIYSLRVTLSPNIYIILKVLYAYPYKYGNLIVPNPNDVLAALIPSKNFIKRNVFSLCAIPRNI